MSDLSKLIDSLEVKFFKVNQKMIQLEKKNTELEALLEKSTEKSQQQDSEISALREQIEQLKMVNALLGSDENKRETKLKINSLIREIDYCIAQLSD
ncbi:hypothetical protein [Flavobacterium okayamense]|uniref:Uncharacterized protein n=1 Tax=Flavobacterium okayamense TaxID=2830782 RepID=A0ABM7SFX7_9FLAO|nr:hypothetical protein [Flavobacterium okayamense]BCY29662.1 hypothetical protein KK2020170_25300 [Flavobacterium okayamense]